MRAVAVSILVKRKKPKAEKTEKTAIELAELVQRASRVDRPIFVKAAPRIGWDAYLTTLARASSSDSFAVENAAQTLRKSFVLKS